MQTVAVLDYGMSNLRSVAKALEYVADERSRIVVTDRPDRLRAADRIVFPGQGAIGQCMLNLARIEASEILAECLREKPYLGICLGLQCLMDASDEDGGTRGLGWLKGRVVRFPGDRRDEYGRRLKVPHMGWNEVAQAVEHPLWNGISSRERFYFVHSYYVAAERKEDVAGVTSYAVEFAAAVARDNLFAVQFHPEKSQHAGLRLLRNFIAWNP
ncbi:MAG: imidazole glycerol phosphate synthase subunit HisH [Gammaproteobacteria bacterium]|nr:imidazole glycerol phosphate synthase subunit HisH [Gammaproteobacteria bacterium]